MSLELARESTRREPTPWVLGLTVAAIMLIFSTGVLVGIFELIDSFSELAAVASVAIVAVGLASTLWELRVKAVWRWIAWGTLLGLLAGLSSAAVLAFMHG
ncbi:DUF2537 domain-containing protein [Gordonia effusa]|uniref:DUF2537 domain-containing protein n=1 Tax=Gordonia effusa TaxID=263908 RepID=UPI0002DF483D|nr:DUF2537 domain-containing protein [Gordonia effusa]